jgi:DNA repair protein RadA/Sms
MAIMSAKKSKSLFICQACGAVSKKWSGKCDDCGEWNTISEEAAPQDVPKGMGSSKSGRVIDFTSLKGQEAPRDRTKSGLEEFDRVLGGGLVAGSVTLIGGDPGIGKSTLLLQAMCALALKGEKCAYISGEEAVDQIRMRAQRLGLQDAPVDLASVTSVRDIVATIEQGKGQDPAIVVVDSIQTMYVDVIDSAPGTVTQVRACTQELIRAAKRLNVAVIVVGHVTKDGAIAGPRVLEHMVDTVLYFEGDRGHQFRILRGVKNRFGPTDEIGVFEMEGGGLQEVSNPSALFLSERSESVSGSAVFAGLEGSRPVLVEIQALVAQTNFATPKRSTVGWDNNRLSMLLAVMEARCGVNFSGYDVYLNIAGGLRITEPAADLAIAAALVSAIADKPVPERAVFFGEIGLSGEIRAVSQPQLRLKESSKLGFEQAFMPKITAKKKPTEDGFSATEVPHLLNLVEKFEAI